MLRPRADWRSRGLLCQNWGFRLAENFMDPQQDVRGKLLELKREAYQAVVRPLEPYILVIILFIVPQAIAVSHTHGSLDFYFGPFHAHFSAPPHPHTRRVLRAACSVHADRGLIGAWHPTLCPNRGFMSEISTALFFWYLERF